jgi:putative endopeptidase
MKTKKTKVKNNISKKCEIGFKPFEKNFKESKEANEARKDIVSKYKPILVENIAPHDNFYNYINYSWIQKVKLDDQQQYIVQVDDFRLTQDKVYRQLHDIIVDYIKNNKNDFANSMRNMYKSIINMNTKTDSKMRAKYIVNKVEELRQDKNNLYKMLAWMNMDEAISPNCPLSWSVHPDNKEPDKFCCYMDGITFSILDLNVYADDGTEIEYKMEYRKKFIENARKIFDITLGEGHGLKAEDVLEVEKDIYMSWSCSEFVDDEDFYNKITISQSETELNFNWKEFSKEIGYKRTPEFFITSSRNFMKCTMKLLLENWTSDKWKSFWCFSFLRMLARITKDWEHTIFKFYGEFERGQSGINVSDAVSSALYMSLPYNTFLTNEYIKKYADEQSLEYVKAMCEDLKLVFRRIVERNKWLSPKTKNYALKKLDYMNFVLGKPDKLIPDPNLKYGLNTYENFQMLMAYRHQMFIEFTGKETIDLPFMDWTQYPVKMTGSQAYIVNASYTPAKNSIYMNWGYMQKPFVDLDERGIEYNLAHMGYTVAHELSHSLDDMGSKYDHTGKLSNWWTDQDRKKFEAKQKDVIKQYEEFALRDGIVFDASIGIGEDLADISAMAICDEFLRDFQQKNKDLIPIRNLSFDAYYTYFAFQQKQKISKKAIRAQLKTNPHPLDVYRCNVPLSRSETFRTIYNVKRNDGMWWHNTDTIW